MSHSNGGLQRASAFALNLVLACVLGLAACKDDDTDDGKTDPEPGKTGQETGDQTKGSAGDKATETNVAPAPCSDDDDCPKGIECYFADADDEMGFCDVNEMHVNDGGTDGGGEVSSTAPAPCDDSDDCPPGIECKTFEPGGPGFCNVEEMSVTPSSAAPAPCDSADDCPPGIECKRFDPGGPGFCNVNEMIEP